MRVAVFLNLKCHRQSGTLLAEEQYVRFWIALGQSLEHSHLCLPIREADPTEELQGFELDLDPGRFTTCPLPFYGSSFELYRSFSRIAREARASVLRVCADVDLMVCVVPNLLGLYLARQARARGVPSVFYIRGNLGETVRFEYAGSWLGMPARFLATVLQKLTEREMKHATTFVVGHELHRRYKRKGYETVPIITSLISEQDIDPPRRRRTAPPYRLLCLGRLSPERGVETLLGALVILKERGGPGFGCDIVGDGSDRSRLEALALRMGLADDVCFHGFIPYGERVSQLYRSADVFVSPSYTEGFPKVLLEAMAHGCPIVCTGVGAIRDVLTDGKDALIVPPRERFALAEAIGSALGDTEKRARIQDGAHETVKSLTVEQMTRVFLDNVTVT